MKYYFELRSEYRRSGSKQVGDFTFITLISSVRDRCVKGINIVFHTFFAGNEDVNGKKKTELCEKTEAFSFRSMQNYNLTPIFLVRCRKTVAGRVRSLENEI